MPFDKFDRYAKAEGFCCPLALLTARSKWSTWAIAEDAGISERQAREWRERARKKQVSCARSKECLLLKALAQTPR